MNNLVNPAGGTLEIIWFIQFFEKAQQLTIIHTSQGRHHVIEQAQLPVQYKDPRSSYFPITEPET